MMLEGKAVLLYKRVSRPLAQLTPTKPPLRKGWVPCTHTVLVPQATVLGPMQFGWD